MSSILYIFDYIKVYWQEDDHDSWNQINHSVGRAALK